MSTQNFTLCFFRSALIIAALLFLAASPALAYFVPSNHQAATLELGQLNFTSSAYATSQNGMRAPEGVAVNPATTRSSWPILLTTVCCALHRSMPWRTARRPRRCLASRALLAAALTPPRLA